MEKKRKLSKKRKQIMCFLFFFIWISCKCTVLSAPEITAPSVVLMEASTGQIIYEKDADEKRSPASVTKVMTLLLVFDALNSQKLSLSDEIRTSAHAKSMGGSQVFLEEGEVQTLDTLLKCIVVASGNDASVAVAEKIAGSEEEFVYQMNRKAQELGMTNTHFVDCCGLTDSNEHYTTARDVATMSRELIVKYPDIYKYSQIWMEDITHTTNRGSESFTLSNTNKLLKTYEWTTGLKTGSTSKAKYCISATANKNNLDMIAVVLGADTTKARFEEAIMLLEHGFQVSQIFEDKNQDVLELLPIDGAVENAVAVEYENVFRYLDTGANDMNTVEKVISLPDRAEAPVIKGDAVGEAVYLLNGTKIGSVPIVYAETVERAGYFDFLRKTFELFLIHDNNIV